MLTATQALKLSPWETTLQSSQTSLHIKVNILCLFSRNNLVFADACMATIPIDYDAATQIVDRNKPKNQEIDSEFANLPTLPMS